MKQSFRFRDFSQAFAFMTEVAMAAERQDHHPTWTNEWNRVDIALCTHSAGRRITDKDWKLASEIDEIAARYASDQPGPG